MGKEIIREPRKKLAKKKMDLTIPIKLEQLGSKEDPCFAKHYDPRAPECGRCGDAEICAIAMGQKNHLLRNSAEKKGSFKDIEETKIVKDVDTKVIIKSIKNRVREMVKMNNGLPMDIQLVIDDVFYSYSKDGFGKKRIRKIIDKMVENSDMLTLRKNTLIWKK